MAKYPEKAQPYLNAIADGVFGDVNIRNWLLQKTPHEDRYYNASVLKEEQKKVRGKTEYPWSNYWCGKDSNCTCRPEGSKGLESDAIFFFRNSDGRVLAVHIEFKHTGESFSFGQAEAYPLRAACFARTHSERKTMNEHQDWVTVLFCGADKSADPQAGYFQRVITHSEAHLKIRNYPDSI